MIFLEYPYVDAATFLANLDGTTTARTAGAILRQRHLHRATCRPGPTATSTDDPARHRRRQPADNSATLYLEIQLPTDDDTALQTILASFQQR